MNIIDYYDALVEELGLVEVEGKSEFFPTRAPRNRIERALLKAEKRSNKILNYPRKAAWRRAKAMFNRKKKS